MRKNLVTIFLIFCFLNVPEAFSAEATIVCHETDKYFFQDGRAERFDGQFEYTYAYDAEKNTLIRTRVYDYRTKKIIADETVYQVQSQLHSDPSLAARYGTAPMIRAFGQTGPDSVEIVTIGPTIVECLQSTGTTSVYSYSERIK